MAQYGLCSSYVATCNNYIIAGHFKLGIHISPPFDSVSGCHWSYQKSTDTEINKAKGAVPRETNVHSRLRA